MNQQNQKKKQPKSPPSKTITKTNLHNCVGSDLANLSSYTYSLNKSCVVGSASGKHPKNEMITEVLSLCFNDEATREKYYVYIYDSLAGVIYNELTG